MPDRTVNRGDSRSLTDSLARRRPALSLFSAVAPDPQHLNNAGQTPAGAARLIANYDVAQFFADLADTDQNT